MGPQRGVVTDSAKGPSQGRGGGGGGGGVSRAGRDGVSGFRPGHGGQGTQGLAFLSTFLQLTPLRSWQTSEPLPVLARLPSDVSGFSQGLLHQTQGSLRSPNSCWG